MKEKEEKRDKNETEQSETEQKLSTLNSQFSTPKTYIKTGAVYRSWVIRVKVGAVERPVEFSGGMLELAKRNCRFTATDKELQKALEKHPLFGREFVVDETTIGGSETDGTVGTAVSSVNDFASAKKHILANYKEYTQADVSTAEKVMALAAELGISFPNWSPLSTLN
jgi:hypothetical protein